ncbi:MAG: cache domain-containing protein, partial [Synergistaceae bacterium]|nr:cache domain-containing protein [Synergistaceae bacterium]
MSFFLVLMAIVVASLVCILVFVRSMRERMDAALIVTTNGLNKDIDSIIGNMKVFGDVMGKWPHLADLVRRGDSTGMNNQLRSYIDVSSFRSITITDIRGYVLSRPHDPYRIGDNISYTECVQRALRGEKATVIEAGSGLSQWGIFHGTPIMRDGAVAGSLVVELSLGDPEMLRRIGEIHGVDVMLYYDDMRINTTIDEHKNQFTNTKAPAAVAEQVVDKGMKHFDELKLAGGGHPLRVLYTPFVFEGYVAGIISAAISTEALETDIRNAVSLVSVAALIFTLMAAGASYAFARSVFRISEEKTKQDILLGLLMKHSPDTIIIFDENMKVVNCCDMFLHRLRLGHLDQIAGRTIDEICAPFLPEADARRVLETCRRGGGKNESVSFELTFHPHWEDYPRS